MLSTFLEQNSIWIYVSIISDAMNYELFYLFTNSWIWTKAYILFISVKFLLHLFQLKHVLTLYYARIIKLSSKKYLLYSTLLQPRKVIMTSSLFRFQDYQWFFLKFIQSSNCTIWMLAESWTKLMFVLQGIKINALNLFDLIL